jgi:DNA-binding transcriptional LysR family regulator
MRVELRQLQAFVAVVDEGSFTAAAARLRTSQASVSRAVAALERAVGTSVLHRTSRELSLTAAGGRILGHARRALEEAAAITRTASALTGELRVGYAWAALGRHTTAVQQRWAAEHPGAALVFVQSNTPSAGLAEGTADVAVLRRPVEDPRLRTALVGVEPRVAAVARDDPLARRRRVALADFAGRTLAVDERTGTTTPDLWTGADGPAATRTTSGVDEWLTSIAAGQAVGITSDATAHQHPRPGVVYRPVRDAPPVPVLLAWWRDSPPPEVRALVRLVCELVGSPRRTV